MQKEKKDKHFLNRPVYEGGPKAMKQFVKENLRYPKEALENKVEGTVSIRYTIDYKGNVIEAKIISGVGYGCDEEAIRLVKLFKFTVEKNRKVRAIFHKNIQIHFRLPKQKAAQVQQQQQQVQYNYISKKEPKESSGQTGGSYGYNITIS